MPVESRNFNRYERTADPAAGADHRSISVRMQRPYERHLPAFAARRSLAVRA